MCRLLTVEWWASSIIQSFNIVLHSTLTWYDGITHIHVHAHYSEPNRLNTKINIEFGIIEL